MDVTARDRISKEPGRRWGPVLMAALTAAGLFCSLVEAQDGKSLDTREARQGDFCIVCGLSHDHIDEVVRYKGRWVALCPDHRKILENKEELARYFARMQARGGLYHEGAIQGQEKPIQLYWFAFGIWVGTALLSAGLCAGLALRKGSGPVQWFFIGLCANAVGLLLVLARPASAGVRLPPGLAKIPATAAPEVCPFCGVFNHPTASACASCEGELAPRAEPEVRRAGKPPHSRG